MANFRKILVANWKANPERESAALRLAKASDFSGVIIAPPNVFLASIGQILKKAFLAAQDCYWSGGAFTGAVAVEQLKSFGIKSVIVGHSERRRNFNESDLIVNKKTNSVLKAGLQPILCIGETLAARKKGLASARNFISRQLTEDLRGLKKSQIDDGRLIVAYEPVWAISPEGKIDEPDDAAAMIRFIKGFLKKKFGVANAKVLYGGSVDSRRAGSFLVFPEIDGLLIGSASLRSDEFRKIVKIKSR